MKEVASIFVNFVNHFAAHKSTLGVLNRASIFVNHFAAHKSTLGVLNRALIFVNQLRQSVPILSPAHELCKLER